jgi:hypothetical protein
MAKRRADSYSGDELEDEPRSKRAKPSGTSYTIPGGGHQSKEGEVYWEVGASAPAVGFEVKKKKTI